MPIEEDIPRKQKIESIKEDVYNFIKENNGKLDLVDIALQFNQFTCDIPGLAAYKLEEEGRVERREVYGTQCAYFVRG